MDIGLRWAYAGGLRYRQGGGLTPKQRASRERVRLHALHGRGPRLGATPPPAEPPLKNIPIIDLERASAQPSQPLPNPAPPLLTFGTEDDADFARTKTCLPAIGGANTRLKINGGSRRGS